MTRGRAPVRASPYTAPVPPGDSRNGIQDPTSAGTNLSDLGRRLLAIRERYIAAGGRLYESDEIDAEIADARNSYHGTKL